MIVALVAGSPAIQTLSYLLNAGRRRDGSPTRAGPATAVGRPTGRGGASSIQAGGVAVASAVAGLVGRRLLDGGLLGGPQPSAGNAGPAAVPGRDRDPPRRRRVAPATGSPRSSSRTTEFYRIDTALIPPTSTPRRGGCASTGMVDREVTLSYADLAELPLFEQYVTIACVSNEVGGNLVGNAKWTGVQLRDVLDDGRRPGRARPSSSGGRSTAGPPGCRPRGSWTRPASR